MAYYSRSTRKLAKNSKRKFIFTLVIIALLGYTTIFWIMPAFINGVGLISDEFKPKNSEESPADNPTLAPPQINIPFEATNSEVIEIKGYSTGQKVEIYLDDELIDTIDAQSDGNFTGSIELRIGTNNIYGKSVDEKNQTSLPSKTIKVLYDNIKPTLEVTEPEDGKSIQGERRLKVAGKTDPDAHVFVNGTQVIVTSDGSFSREISLSDGENNIVVKSQDQALNEIEINRKVNFTP